MATPVLTLMNPPMTSGALRPRCTIRPIAQAVGCLIKVRPPLVLMDPFCPQAFQGWFP